MWAQSHRLTRRRSLHQQSDMRARRSPAKSSSSAASRPRLIREAFLRPSRRPRPRRSQNLVPTPIPRRVRICPWARVWAVPPLLRGLGALDRQMRARSMSTPRSACQRLWTGCRDDPTCAVITLYPCPSLAFGHDGRGKAGCGMAGDTSASRMRRTAFRETSVACDPTSARPSLIPTRIRMRTTIWIRRRSLLRIARPSSSSRV